MTDIAFEKFDPRDAGDEILRAVHKLNTEIEGEYLPEEPPTPYEEMVAMKRVRAPHKRHTQWLASGGEEPIASASLSYETLEENKHLGWFWIQVLQSHRRRGLGSDLLLRVIEEAKSAGKSVLGGWAWKDGPGEPFLEKLGGTQRILERQSRLWVKDVNVAMMNDWVNRAKERATDYVLDCWEGPTPDVFIERFAAIYDVMNTAPREDLDMEDEKTTPEILRQQEKARLERGNPWWSMVAIHEPSNEMAGFTELYFSGYRDDIAWQGNTGVDPAHRNKGLGRWLKAAMFLKLLDERPNTNRIHTWNAGSNEPMLAINNAMGFRAAQWWTTWQAPIEVWEKSVRGRV